ncbi:MAG: hypothetical protein Q9217_006873 [Psora testacea]
MSRHSSSSAINSWLSRLPSPKPTDDLSTPSPRPLKRKRANSEPLDLLPPKPSIRNHSPRRRRASLPQRKRFWVAPISVMADQQVSNYKPTPVTFKLMRKQPPITPEPTSTSKASYHSSSRLSHLKPISPSASTKSTSTTVNVENVRKSLSGAGMRFDDEDSYSRYPELGALVDAIAFSVRNESVQPSSVKKILAYRKRNATKNEATYYPDLIGLMLKIDERNISSYKHTLDEEMKEHKRAYADDGLDKVVDRDFVRGVLPIPETSLNAVGTTNPKPDYTFGLEEAQFPPALPPQILKLVRLAPGIEHPFLAIEAKGPDWSIERAENQCIRDGATMVAARRGLEQLAKKSQEGKSQEAGSESEQTPQPRPPLGADLGSIAFSLAWVPQYAALFVHWHETTTVNGKLEERYHMRRRKTYDFNNDDDGWAVYSKFRGHLRNILDWGCTTRRYEVEEVIKRAIDNVI